MFSKIYFSPRQKKCWNISVLTVDLVQKAYRMKISISAKLSLYRNVLVECNLEKYNNMLEIVLSYTLQQIFTISQVEGNQMLSENSSLIHGKIL